jgi:hypothetical protein
MFDRLTQSGIRVIVVAGSEDVLRLHRGEEPRYEVLTCIGYFNMERFPHLEHTLLERTGRDRVAEFLRAWVLSPGTDTAAPPRPQAMQR